MILPHLTYCLTSWAQACCTTSKPIQSVYKQALKVLDKKPNSHHHCYILRKHELLSWENLVQYADVCLVFKILNALAPLPLSIFVKQKTQNHGSRSTRSAMRGDCIVPKEKYIWSICFLCESFPCLEHTAIRHIQLYHLSHLHKNIKTRLKANQTCEHRP